MNNLLYLIDRVIMELTEKIQTESSPQKLVLLLEKYQSAKAELEESGHLRTSLAGGVRAYLDSYSDYMNNPLLDDMYDVETIVKSM